MRFLDLFTSYKVGLKGNKNTIPFMKLPLYRKIAVISTFTIGVIGLILCLLGLNIAAIIVWLLIIIATKVFFSIDSSEKNMKTMLNKFYKPHSEKRMTMLIKVLQDYQIDIYNHESLDLLIEEAQKAQIQCDYLAFVEKPLKVFSVVIIPIVAFFSKKLYEETIINVENKVYTIIQIATMVFLAILVLISFCLLVTLFIKKFFYRDYNSYEELIYDLRQIKLFYTKNGEIVN